MARRGRAQWAPSYWGRVGGLVDVAQPAERPTAAAKVRLGPAPTWLGASWRRTRAAGPTGRRAWPVELKLIFASNSFQILRLFAKPSRARLIDRPAVGRRARLADGRVGGPASQPASAPTRRQTYGGAREPLARPSASRWRASCHSRASTDLDRLIRFHSARCARGNERSWLIPDAQSASLTSRLTSARGSPTSLSRPAGQRLR